MDMSESAASPPLGTRRGALSVSRERSGDPRDVESVSRHRSGVIGDLEGNQEKTRPPITARSTVHEKDYRSRNWDKTKLPQATANSAVAPLLS